MQPVAVATPVQDQVVAAAELLAQRRQSEPEFSFAEIEADITALGLTCAKLSAMNVIAGGLNNRLARIEYAGEAFILKHYSPARRPDAVRETAALSALNGKAPFAPALVASAIDRPAILYRYLDGQPIGRRSLTTIEQDHIVALLNNLWDTGRHLETSSSLPSARYAPANPEILFNEAIRPAWLTASQAAAPHREVTWAYEQILGKAEKVCEQALRHWKFDQPSLCHGDLHLANIILASKEQGLRLIDWEHAGSGDPAFDLAWFVHAPNQLALGESQIARIEQGLFVGKHRRSLYDRYRVYAVLVAVWWACRHVAVGLDGDRSENGKPRRWHLSAQDALILAGQYVMRAQERLDALLTSRAFTRRVK